MTCQHKSKKKQKHNTSVEFRTACLHPHTHTHLLEHIQSEFEEKYHLREHEQYASVDTLTCIPAGGRVSSSTRSLPQDATVSEWSKACRGHELISSCYNFEAANTTNQHDCNAKQSTSPKLCNPQMEVTIAEAIKGLWHWVGEIMLNTARATTGGTDKGFCHLVCQC